jgi:hypothetical protein
MNEENWDWTKTNNVLAEEHKVSREWVRQLRLKFNHPKVPKRTERQLFLLEHAEEFKKLTAREVSEKYGLPYPHIYDSARRLGVKFAKGLDGMPPKLDWKKADWTKTAEEIAAAVGTTIGTVYMRRHRMKYHKNIRLTTPENAVE